MANAVIAGIGATDFSKDSGRSELQLAAEASLAAIRDAGLTPADIDGTITFTLDSTDELSLGRNLGIKELTWASRTPWGGAMSYGNLQHAAAAIAAGEATHVLIYRAFNERSGHRFGQARGQGQLPDGNWVLPFGINTVPKIFALWYQRYLETYGFTNADLAPYAVAARDWAATNPAAWFYGRPITEEDHQSSRWIAEPVLRLLDCCQESDGGVAMVVTSAERARDLAQRPVEVVASMAHPGGQAVMFQYYEDDPARCDGAIRLAERLWKEAGLGPSDMDAAMIYENFSPIVYMLLEAFGFCGRGEAVEFIREGNIGRGGSLPVNTHGGLLGEAYIHGMNNVTEGVRQLRGTAANQLDDPHHIAIVGGTSALVLRHLA
jgi:acetyl-CoA acetyltransferase